MLFILGKVNSIEVNIIKIRKLDKCVFKCMVGWEELYVMVGNKYFFIVIVMCIKIEIVSIMIWRIFEIK